MSQHDGLNRRSFLRNVGMTAVAGAVGSSTPLAAAATGSALSAEPVGPLEMGGCRLKRMQRLTDERV